MESDPVSLTVARTLPRRDVVVVEEEVEVEEARVTAFEEVAISSSPSIAGLALFPFFLTTRLTLLSPLSPPSTPTSSVLPTITNFRASKDL